MAQWSVTHLGKVSPWHVSRTGPYMRMHQEAKVTASDLAGLRGSRSMCPSAPTIPSTAATPPLPAVALCQLDLTWVYIHGTLNWKNQILGLSFPIKHCMILYESLLAVFLAISMRIRWSTLLPPWMGIRTNGMINIKISGEYEVLFNYEALELKSSCINLIATELI